MDNLPFYTVLQKESKGSAANSSLVEYTHGITWTKSNFKTPKNRQKPKRRKTPEIVIIEPEQAEPQFVTRQAGHTPPLRFRRTPSPASPKAQYVKHRAAHTPPPSHQLPMAIEMVEEYHLAKGKMSTYNEFNIFTKCDETHTTCAKNATYGRIAETHNREKLEDFRNCRARSLYEAIMFNWLTCQLNRPNNEVWTIHELHAQQFDSSETAAKFFHEQQVIMRNRDIGQDKHLKQAIEIWRTSCDHFGEIFNQSALKQLKFNPIYTAEQQKTDCAKWIERLNQRANEITSKERSRRQFPDYIHFNARTLLIGDNTADLLQKQFQNSRWYTHFPDQPLRLTTGPQVKTIIYAYQATDEDMVKQITPHIHRFKSTDIEITLILQKDDNSEWLWHKKEFINLNKQLDAGFFVFNRRIGEAKALADRIKANMEEPMQIDSQPSTSTLAGSKKPYRKVTTVGQRMLNSLMVISLFTLLATQCASAQPIRQKRFGGVGIWHGPQILKGIWGNKAEPEQRVASRYSPAVNQYIQRVVAMNATAIPPTTPVKTTSLTTIIVTTTAPPTTRKKYIQTSWPTSTTRAPPLWISTTTWPTTKRTTTQTMPTSTTRPLTQTKRPTPIIQKFFAQRQSQWKGDPAHVNGMNVFWCSDRGSTIWELKGSENSPFCRPPPALTAHWTTLTITLFLKIHRPELVQSGWHCAIKQTNEQYYTNLFGDRFVDINRTFVPVSKPMCRQMALHQLCPMAKTEMTQSANNSWSTNDKLDVQFPGPIEGLFKGTQTSTTTNCFVQPAQLYVKHHNLQLQSPVHHVEHCEYSKGYCQLPDNSSIIWKANCPTEQCYTCDFEKSEQIRGEFTKTREQASAIWISEDRQKALTFTSAQPLTACDGSNIVLSKQNFGIRKEQYDTIMRDDNHPRAKRYVEPEQLASQLSASQIATNMALSQLYLKECQQNVRVADPTWQARKLLNRENLQARWIGETTFAVFPCLNISLTDISYRAAKDCYMFIPIKVHFNDTTKDAFLDPEMRIISFSAQVVRCSLLRYHHLQLKRNPSIWLRIDTKTGIAQQLPQTAVHELYETVLNQTDSDLDLNPLIFHHWQLSNDSDNDIFPHIAEFAEMEQFKKKFEQHKAARADALGALSGGIEGWTLRWLKDWINDVMNWWMRLACAYATFLFLRDVLIPCLLAYLINPIRITFMSLVGFRPRRQPIAHRQRFDAIVERRRLSRTPQRPSIRLRTDRPSSPITLDLDSRTATFRSRASSLTLDTPFGRSRPMRLADD